MLTHRIIPCLDVKSGRVVKGVNFVDLVDAGDPVQIARAYDEQGADELVFLDITASHEGRGIIHDVVRQVAEQCFMPFTVGGGIRTIDDVTALIQAGAEKVSINTAAVVTPEIVSQTARRFGTCATVVNIDPKRVPIDDYLSRAGKDAPVTESTERPGTCFEVHTHGGRTPVGLDALDWAQRVVELGAGEIVLTSMDGDGTQTGYDIEITRLVAQAVSVPVVASGGAGSPEHIADVLEEGCADAALAASIFHFGTYTIAETKEYLARRGLPVRTVVPLAS
ncbi:imidazole glycerol phosphate synthase subunit HisF [Mucisphaera calidilacus]|uniref:Imidazole glycerol phosphate synthase subunit HisF n=1 Tax=Mucisphaera calidilacus TaxID=2527982 RepID=A0A518BTH5_9BACT|nr:imidazole glycerol phosphate synthase subunit HisF [Mucisphaera calidilacus]QDU70265.1 Imidazole glycerol phosphate synthase subunit HisF [Mucisphaera calidilacus]